MRVHVTGNAFDPVSGLGEINVKYSTDGGDHWASSLLCRPEETGAGQNPVQSAEIGPFCTGQNVTMVLLVEDQLGNRGESAPLNVTI